METFKELGELLNSEEKTKSQLIDAHDFLLKRTQTDKHYSGIINEMLVPQMNDTEFGVFMTEVYHSSLDDVLNASAYLDTEASAVKRAIISKAATKLKKAMSDMEKEQKEIFLSKAPRGTQLTFAFDDDYAATAKTTASEKFVVDDADALYEALKNAGLDGSYTEVAIKTTALKKALKEGMLPAEVTKYIHIEESDKVTI